MTTNYRASSSLTLSINGFGWSSSLTVGRASAAYSNAANQDDFVIPTLRTRSGGTIVANTTIELWAFAQRADGTWPELFTAPYTGADGTFTANNRDAFMAGAVLLGSAQQTDTAARDFVIRGRELSMVFGAVPQQVAFFVTHNMGASSSLDASAGNHALTIQAGNYA
jgi:hypothetical protein